PKLWRPGAMAASISLPSTAPSAPPSCAPVTPRKLSPPNSEPPSAEPAMPRMREAMVQHPPPPRRGREKVQVKKAEKAVGYARRALLHDAERRIGPTDARIEGKCTVDIGLPEPRLAQPEPRQAADIERRCDIRMTREHGIAIGDCSGIVA